MIQLRTVCLSAHLDSFCRRLNELEEGAFEFVYTDTSYSAMRNKIGWRMVAPYQAHIDSPHAVETANNVDVLITMHREWDLIEQRLARGLKTFYMSERWFKPIPIDLPIPLFGFSSRLHLKLPGHFRLLSPSYRRMARRFIRLMDSPSFYILPIGVHAVRDFVRLHQILHGNFLAWFRPPRVEIDRQLGGAVAGFPRIRLWGYFVEPSTLQSSPPPPRLSTSRALRVLWVGRMDDWKRVDVLIAAFRKLKRPAALLLVGEGKERQNLEKQAGALCVVERDFCSWMDGKIAFHDYVKSNEARKLMREADVYVMPSNAQEGWGAAVSDAIAEGCRVISTCEAGSSATVLPESNLYHATSVSELAYKLEHIEQLKFVDAACWSGERAAEIFFEMVRTDL